MGTWVLTISAGLDEHWNIAKKIQAWDVTTRLSFEIGDWVYFWQASNKGIVGRAQVAATITPAPQTTPWLTSTERNYKWRVDLARFDDHAGTRVTWPEIVQALGGKGRRASQPQYSNLASAAHDMEKLFGKASDTHLFSTTDLSEGPEGSFPTLSVEPFEDRGDHRSRVSREVADRPGQGAFRTMLLAQYGGTCAVTGTAEEDSLDAAHVHPHEGEHTDVASNGLLLRADIHRLFDKHLLTIVEGADGDFIVRVAPSIKDHLYRGLDRKPLPSFRSLPAAQHGAHPLREHNEKCTWLVEATAR